MPNIKSSKKRVKVGERNRLRNIAQKSSMRTAIKIVASLTAEGKVEEALAKLPMAFSKIDKAIKRKIIHKNAGARIKSRLAAKIKAAQETAA